MVKQLAFSLVIVIGFMVAMFGLAAAAAAAAAAWTAQAQWLRLNTTPKFEVPV